MSRLELHRVSKAFDGVPVLRSVDLDVRAGEVHALVGENGAGKSTLIKLVGGVYTPDSGTISVDGHLVSFTAPHDASNAGIQVLYQESNLIPQLSVGENIFLGAEPYFKHLPVINWDKLYRQSALLLEMLGVPIDPHKPVHKLTVAEQQMVEIARTLHSQPGLLLMDEPTAALSKWEVDLLFKLIGGIKARGIGILFITHRLDEVMTIADRVTVLRNGQRVATLTTADTSIDQIVNLMTGRSINRRFSRQPVTAGREALRCERLTRTPAFKNISFGVHEGEIVGLAGLVGSGRSTLVRCIFGLDQPDSGTVYVNGKAVGIHSPGDAIALGIGLLPERRQDQALLLDMSARENITLTQLRESGMLIDLQAETTVVDKYARRLRIKMPTPEIKTRYLSGGTQQKIVLSRWLAVQPRILIFDEPTQGIDIGARLEIYRMLGELASQGIAILIISSEFVEIVGLCDRALVMRDGELVATLQKHEITEQALMRYAMGDRKDAARSKD